MPTVARLRVELHGELLGHLVTGRGRDFDFEATADALRTHGLGSRVLSLAVPLSARGGRTQRALRTNYFAELLPEGDALERLAREARILPDDVIAMLRLYGRDVAGAVQVWDPEAPGEPRTPTFELVTGEEVAQMLANIPLEPLGNRLPRGKTSLAGVQNKIVLAHTDDGWARALDGYPSTHIVKPVVGKFPTMIFDEEYGSRFARGLELAHFDTRLESFGGTTALVIERYDRDRHGGRIHQEDFNQVLGLASANKYEMYGGKGLRDVAKHLSPEDQVRLLRMTTLSTALGNLDMHMKNISLVHSRDGEVTLAPMYDVVPQAHLEFDGEVALFVSGVRLHADITKADLVAEGASWGVMDAEAIVDETLRRVLEISEAERPHIAAHMGVQDDVLRFTNNLIAGLTVSGGTTAGVSAPTVTRTQGGWGWDNPVVGR